jgi:hypothetical protein
MPHKRTIKPLVRGAAELTLDKSHKGNGHVLSSKLFRITSKLAHVEKVSPADLIAIELIVDTVMQGLPPWIA